MVLVFMLLWPAFARIDREWLFCPVPALSAFLKKSKCCCGLLHTRIIMWGNGTQLLLQFFIDIQTVYEVFY